MRYTESYHVCQKHRSLLSETIETEEWLHNMAMDGLLLQKITGSEYHFEHVQPTNTVFFLMNPETGTNSDGWVFYELENKFGKRIPHTGATIFSPSHVLAIDPEWVDCSSGLIEYYYRYRNYRLLKRFFRNAVFSLVFFSLGIAVSLFNLPEYLIAMSPYLFVSGLLCIHFFSSFCHFYKICTSRGFENSKEKPTRPGY